MIFKQIVLWILLLVIMFFTVRAIFSLFAYMFKKHSFAMYVPSFNRHIRLMKAHLKLTRGKKLVDLGCGDGKAMRFFADTFGVQCDGYEMQSFPYYYGKLCNFVFGYPQIKIYKKNFLSADIKHYDYIYLYLLPNQMADIESWIFKNMSDHTIIISNSFQFALHKPYDVIKDRKGRASIFLYKK